MWVIIFVQLLLDVSIQYPDHLFSCLLLPPPLRSPHPYTPIPQKKKKKLKTPSDINQKVGMELKLETARYHFFFYDNDAHEES